MSVDHYENFPVASWLCPAPLRPAVVALYHFARTADDLADEGEAPPAERLAQLARYRQALQRAVAGEPEQADGWPQVFAPLRQAIARHGLPPAPLADLLSAFEQDVTGPLYRDRGQLLDYCRRSANPVGRLLLHLYGVDAAAALRESDDICTALQLINFWQDLGLDLSRGRSYLTDEDLARHGLSRAEVRPGGDDARTRSLVADLCDWAGSTLRRGEGLVHRLPGRAGWELRLVVQGGRRILERIRRMDHHSLSHRPTLRAWDAPLLLARALAMRASPARTVGDRP